MRNKKSKIILLLTSILLLLVGFSIVYPEKVGLCLVDDFDCIFQFPVFEIGEPLFNAMLIFLPLSILLLFIRPEVFKSWSKFAIVAIPLAVIWIALTPVQDGAGGIGLIGFSREVVTWIASIAFLVVSLAIIIFKSLRNSN